MSISRPFRGFARAFCFLLAGLLSSAAALSQRESGPRLEGTVTDLATGEPIAAVNIRILGTTTGTVSNEDGRYRLMLVPGNRQRLIFSHLAYEPDTVDIGADERPPGTLNVSLRAATIWYPEVIVLAEDPALEIIRKAIANKRKWTDLLKSYRFEAYTRQVIMKDTSVASIAESFSEGYVLSGDTIRERILQKRQTANIPAERNVAAVRRLVNFNDDRISLFNININNERRSYSFTGPTAPDALENYDYHLLRTRRSGGIEMYEIEMRPKTALKPLFSGTIIIADRSFAVVGVDLVPNEKFGLPFLKDIELRYRQQFSLYDSAFWMPADIRIDGGFSISIIGFGFPRLGFRQISSLYDYEINVPVPDSITTMRRLTVDSSAAVYDSSYWLSGIVVPFTREENRAYATLDSTQTLERQFRPGGVLGGLGSDGSGSFMENIDFRFTRVEGFYLGAGRDFRDLFGPVDLGVHIGYGTSNRRWRYRVSAEAELIGRHRLGAGAAVFRSTENVPDGGYYESLVNSLTALLDKNDYRDYFRAGGWEFWIVSSFGRSFSTRLTFSDRKESTMPVVTHYSFISNSSPYRPNPPAVEGRFRGLSLSLRLGLEPAPLDIITNDFIRLTIEHTSPSFLASDFDYTRVTSDITWTFPTFASRLLFPPSVRIRAHLGKAFGNLPPQKLLSADTRSSVLGPFGVLRGGEVGELRGDAVAAFLVEHNFRSLPFLALGLPFLYRNGIELIAHGGFARTWTDGRPVPAAWYSEAGLGINRILDILRLDLTYRFREPGAWYLTLGGAYLF